MYCTQYHEQWYSILQHTGSSTIVPVYLEQGYLAGQLQWTGQVIVRVENLDTVIIRKHICKEKNEHF